MFAPVVHRFRIYKIETNLVVKGYMDAMLSHPAMVAWTEAAMAETLVIPRFETD